MYMYKHCILFIIFYDYVFCGGNANDFLTEFYEWFNVRFLLFENKPLMILQK